MAGVYDVSSMPSTIPSVSACWRMAREEKEELGAQLDRYYELLEEHGHRRESGRWV